MPFDSIAAAKKDGFPTSAEGIALSLAQINKLAEIYDAIKKAATAKNPFSVAWTAWKKLYKKVGDRWTEIKVASIQFGTEQFVASPVTNTGIPSHAIQIEGKLIHLGTKNLAGWGVTDAATDQIMAGIPGVPIRACSAQDPHACDYAFDNKSHIGYGVRSWVKDGWLWASAAITDKNAVKHISDGTWTPLGKGGWSVAGLPTATSSGFDTTGLIDGYRPTGISLVFAPAIPAFEGSGFDMVAAAVQKTIRKAWKVLWANGRAVQFFEDETDADHWITSGKGKKWFEFSSKTFSDVLRHKNGRSYRVHPKGTKMEFKSEMVAAAIQNHDHGDDNMKEVNEGGDLPVTYTQDDLDAKIKDALDAQKTEFDADAKKVHDAELVKQKTEAAETLAKQKVEYDAAIEKLAADDRAAFDARIAEMTPTPDVEKMIAAAVTTAAAKTQADTLEAIERKNLSTEYSEMLTASVVLGAPYMTDNAIDHEKLAARMSEVCEMKVAAISDLITDGKMMMAAAAPAQSAFDQTIVPGQAPGVSDQDTKDMAAIMELRADTGRL